MPLTPPKTETWLPGTVIPGTVYRIVRVLGRGGMGEVFEVEHTNLGVKRALKVLLSTYSGRDDLARRLKIEAQGLAKIKHPNLVEVYDLGAAADGRIFFAMELLDGTTLRDILQETGPMKPLHAVTFMAQVLDGLAAAHREGMLHRDVKPENIFVCRSGVVKLLDFGVAKAVYASMLEGDKITMAGTTVGTPRYMSVEQAEGDEVDGRTDVYSAGLVLWELLVGRPAFDQDGMLELVQAKRRGVPSLEAMRVPGVTSELSAIVSRACAVKPRDRWESAEAFAAALRTVTGAPSRVALQSAVATEPSSLGSKGATQMMPSPREAAGVSGNDRNNLSRAIIDDLTMRIDSVASVDRDGRTKTSAGASPARYGPAGTRLLPAVSSSSSSGPQRALVSEEELPKEPVRRSRDGLDTKVLVLAVAVLGLVVIIGAALVYKYGTGLVSSSEEVSPELSAKTAVADPPPSMKADAEKLSPLQSSEAVSSARRSVSGVEFADVSASKERASDRKDSVGSTSKKPSTPSKTPKTSSVSVPSKTALPSKSLKTSSAPKSTKPVVTAKLPPAKTKTTANGSKPKRPAEPVLPASGL